MGKYLKFLLFIAIISLTSCGAPPTQTENVESEQHAPWEYTQTNPDEVTVYSVENVSRAFKDEAAALMEDLENKIGIGGAQNYEIKQISNGGYKDSRLALVAVNVRGEGVEQTIVQVAWANDKGEDDSLYFYPSIFMTSANRDQITDGYEQFIGHFSFDWTDDGEYPVLLKLNSADKPIQWLNPLTNEWVDYDSSQTDQEIATDQKDEANTENEISAEVMSENPSYFSQLPGMQDYLEALPQVTDYLAENFTKADGRTPAENFNDLNLNGENGRLAALEGAWRILSAEEQSKAFEQTFMKLYAAQDEYADPEDVTNSALALHWDEEHSMLSSYSLEYREKVYFATRAAISGSDKYDGKLRNAEQFSELEKANFFEGWMFFGGKLEPQDISDVIKPGETLVKEAAIYGDNVLKGTMYFEDNNTMVMNFEQSAGSKKIVNGIKEYRSKLLGADDNLSIALYSAVERQADPENEGKTIKFADYLIDGKNKLAANWFLGVLEEKWPELEGDLKVVVLAENYKEGQKGSLEYGGVYLAHDSRREGETTVYRVANSSGENMSELYNTPQNQIIFEALMAAINSELGGSPDPLKTDLLNIIHDPIIIIAGDVEIAIVMSEDS